MGLITKMELIHPTNKNKIVRLEKDAYSLNLMACRNGYQYSGMTIDEDMLPIIKQIIEDWERNQ